MIQKKYILPCLILIFLSVSCKKTPHDLPVSGDITISTQKFGTTVYYTYGYSFEKDEFIKILNLNEKADIVPVDNLNLTGETTGMFLSVTNNNPNGFYLNGTFPSLFSAEIFFISYFDASAPSFISLTDTIKPNQVFTMRTTNNNWVKFLIKETRPVQNTSGGKNYFETDLKYVIQRDGTPVFPE